MAQYIVKVLEVQGIGRKIHKGGSKVTEKDFPPGHAVELAKSGHLELVNKPKPQVAAKIGNKKPEGNNANKK